MKRLPSIATLLLGVVFCLSLGFWLSRWIKAPARSIQAVTVQSAEPNGNWGSIFGLPPQQQVQATDVQLKGVIFAKHQADSQVIVSLNNQANQAVRMNQDIGNGAILKEVGNNYIVISNAGSERRIELPANAHNMSGLSIQIAAPATPPMAPPSIPAVAPGHSPAPAYPNAAPQVTPGLPTASLPGNMGASQ